MLNFVVALGAEAAPLVEHYRLRLREMVNPFPLFEAGHLRLIVSGMGRVNTASAVAWLAGRDDGKNGGRLKRQAWLNIGIGGSRAIPLGCTVIAQEVMEAASEKRWRMPSAAIDLQPARIVTVDRPERVYDQPVVYDMEASGFVASVQRFTPASLAHCVKVISDGPGTPPAELDAARLSELIFSALPSIEALVVHLNDSVTERSSSDRQRPGIEGFTSLGEFSVDQLCQLQRLLQRAWREGIAIEINPQASTGDPQNLLHSLHNQLAAHTTGRKLNPRP